MSYKSIEVSGKTEEEALQKALKELGLERDDVSVEILERAKSGFLGFKTTPAKIRVSYEAPDLPKEEIEEEPNPSMEFAEKVETPSTAEVVSHTNKEFNDERAKKAETFLIGLFEKMNVSAVPEINETEHGISIELKGEKLGSIIGRRGETLDAIQHLTNYSVNRGMDSRVRISVDAENYRKKREESLVNLAERMAGKAVRFKRSFTLEPMNSYERHVIHAALQTNNMVTTYSTGTEPNRRIVVAYNRDHVDNDNASGTTYREWS